MKVNPSIVAASIAGGGIGLATNFMVKGEQSENRGDTLIQQFGHSTIGGLSGGIVGAGIGAGVSGTAIALSKVMRGR